MKERPILFSGEMVRALLAGTKTQTRRAVKHQPGPSCLIEEGFEGESPFVYSALYGDGPGHDVHEARTPCVCPYGQPGDRLWVREAWRTTGDAGRADYLPPRDLQPYKVWYEADGAAPADECVGKFRQSMFMPRWASRITLEVTAVRVQRLQDISGDDAAAEGWPGPDAANSIRSAYPVAWYSRLWDHINGTGSWDANPFVWVVEFKRIP